MLCFVWDCPLPRFPRCAHRDAATLRSDTSLTDIAHHPHARQGINMQDITKLKAAGICTVLGVAQTTRKNLLKIKVRRVAMGMLARGARREGRREIVAC